MSLKHKLLCWSPEAKEAPFGARQAAICLLLRELFEEEGEKPPMLLFEEANGHLEAESIDDIGHTHHVHRELMWDPTPPDFIPGGKR